MQYSSWEPGESWLSCDIGGDCTPGPAEGIFYYEDDRSFTFAYDLDMPWPAHFRVTRRAEDVGKTATFVVRVEHNRGWVSLRHADWPIDPVTGNRYQEFPLTLTGNQRQLVGRIELLFTGRPGGVWEYSAEIKQLEDVSDGAVLIADQEAEYWTVLESSSRPRKRVHRLAEPGWPAYDFPSPTPDPVSEGQEVTFTLKTWRSYPYEPLEVQVRTWEPNRSSPDGTNPTDQVHNVTFPAVPVTDLYNYPSWRSATFTVTATDDTEYEVSDFLIARLAANIGSFFGIEQTEVRIEDDDDHPTISLSVNFGQSSYAVDEGGTVQVTVTLDADPERPVTIPITTMDQNGASASDYSGVPADLTFNSGEREQSFTIQAAQDSVDDEDESVKLGFGTLPAGVSEGSTAEATVSITDDDVPAVTVSFEQATYTVDEGDMVQVTVTLDVDPERTVTVPLTATPQDGATSDDYSGVPADLTFNSGEMETSFTFSAAEDDLDDDGESVKISFDTLPPRVNAGATSDTTFSINDDDVPYVIAGFRAADYIAFEGHTVEVTVTLSEDPERTVTIPVTTTDQGGATGSDYSGVPPSLTFNSGETAKSFTFTAVDDTVAEDGESVKIGFGALPPRVSAGETTVFIKDEVPSVTASFEQGSYGVVEGDSVTVTVTLSADPERTVAIPLSPTIQDGASNADYSMPASIVFKRGETANSFSFEAESDRTLDDGESVAIGFGALPGGIEVGSPSETVVSIDDNSRVTHLDRVNPNGTVNHQTTVAGEFKVRIYFIPEGEGLLEEELEVTNGSIVDFRNIPVGALNVWYVDILPELGANAVTVRVPADVVEGGNQAAEVTYDAVPPLIATLTTSAVMPVIEEFVVTVTFDQDVTPLPGTAEGDVKWYFSPAEDLTISHGTYVGYEKITNRVYNVIIRPSMAVGTSVVALPERKVATGRITDVWNLAASIDVAAGKRTVTFEQAAYSVGEGDDVVVRVILDEDPLNTVVIPITATGQGGATDADFSISPTSVTFNSGETSKTFTFSAIDDDLDDDGESVTIAIGSPLPEIIVTGVTHETTVPITDNDEAGVTVSETALEVPEGQQATYTVVLDTQPIGDVTVTIEGVAGTDLSLEKTTLTFTAQDWNTTQTVTVTAVQDHDAVDDTATLTHAVASTADTDYDGLSADVNVTVVDDDTAGVTVTPRVHHITEGENAPFSIVLDTQPTEDVKVKIIFDPPFTFVFTPQNWSTPRDTLNKSGHSSIENSTVFGEIIDGPANICGLGIREQEAQDPPGDIPGAHGCSDPVGTDGRAHPSVLSQGGPRPSTI